MLHVSLFGPLTVARQDGEARSKQVDISGRPGSLFAYLALAKGRFFTRSELMSALWTDRGEAISPGTFNTTLWRLRKTLERPPLAATAVVMCDRRGAVGLPGDGSLQLDVEEFARCVTPSLDKPLEQLGEADVVNLRHGVALYRDDILAGFTDDWALRERELHRRLLLNSLGRLMHLSVLARDHAGAIRFAQEILDRDPLREDIHRELMRLFLMSGQRAMALRQFERCRTALRDELAIVPMRETMAAYQQIAASAIRVEAGEQHGAAEPAPPITTRSSSDEGGADGADGGTARQMAARRLLENARRYLAQADAELQRTLPFFDDDVAAGPPH